MAAKAKRFILTVLYFDALLFSAVSVMFVDRHLAILAVAIADGYLMIGLLVEVLGKMRL